jgi:hypothetical protein
MNSAPATIHPPDVLNVRQIPTTPSPIHAITHLKTQPTHAACAPTTCRVAEAHVAATAIIVLHR